MGRAPLLAVEPVPPRVGKGKSRPPASRHDEYHDPAALDELRSPMLAERMQRGGPAGRGSDVLPYQASKVETAGTRPVVSF